MAKKCIHFEDCGALGICWFEQDGRILCGDPYNTECPDYADNIIWEEYKAKYNLEEVKIADK